jgi:hypothetical protein
MSPELKKKRGRPAGQGRGRGVGVMLRLHPPLRDSLDAWIAAQPDPKPSRPEAVRQLVERGLSADRPPASS